MFFHSRYFSHLIFIIVPINSPPLLTSYFNESKIMKLRPGSFQKVPH